MCGILAIIDPSVSSETSGETAARMLDRMRHRGPNDHGIFRAGTLTLGMCRLSILDITKDRWAAACFGFRCDKIP